MSGDDDLMVQARAALLDALEALGPHVDNVVVIGAQAIYLHTGAIDLAIAETTKDADVALDPRGMADTPRVEEALRGAGFTRGTTGAQPGAWLSPTGMPVDVMVPEALAGPGASNRRGARLPPHDNGAMRRAVGLEACVVDNEVVTIAALAPNDNRSLPVRVAGPGGLMVAKLHKVGERLEEGQESRLLPKDSHDLYRLLVAVPTPRLADAFRRLLDDDLARTVTASARDYLERYFRSSVGDGALLAGRAERGIGDPEQVAASVAALTDDLLEALGRAPGER